MNKFKPKIGEPSKREQKDWNMRPPIKSEKGTHTRKRLNLSRAIRGGKHLLSLSGGKGVSIGTESSAIPASDVVVKRPKVFFCFNGDVNIGAKIDKQI